jgi:ferredoxin
MQTQITINPKTCTACGLCSEICPNLIMQVNDESTMALRPDRLPLCIQCGQCMAICPSQAIVVAGLAYSQDFFELPGGSVTAMPFLEMIQTRRATRVFKDQPVPRELLEKVVQATSFAPPGFTPLKTEVVVVQDTAVTRQALPEMIKVYDNLVKAMSQPVGRFFVRRKVGEAKYNTLTRHVIPLMKSRLPELKYGTEDTITRGAPAMIVFHADRDADNYEGDIHIALTYAFLAAHALGLGATAIDLIPPAIQNNQILRKLFKIPERNVVVSALILGYARYRYQRGIKHNLKSVIWI